MCSEEYSVSVTVTVKYNIMYRIFYVLVSVLYCCVCMWCDISVVCQFTCTEHCPEWAPAELLEVTEEESTGICVTWEMYYAERGGLR